jgi:hypothetical protein
MTCRSCRNFRRLSDAHGICFSQLSITDAGLTADRVEVLASSDACAHHQPRAIHVLPVCAFRATFRGGEGARD